MPDGTRHIYILLSTFNGARYLPELIESLLAQTYRHFSIHIRDDGSSDNTIEVISHYSKQHSNIHVQIGHNIGVIQSFYHLLSDLNPISENALFAFCDQDDYWLADKLDSAVKMLSTVENPAASLYCCRQRLCDSQLQHLGYSGIPPFYGFENALVENIALGCTMVFGVDIRTKFLHAAPEYMMMHDWWAYLIAAAFGEVLYDPEAHILYRQHSSNTVGWNKSILHMLGKASNFMRNVARQQGLQALRQAQYLLENYPELSKDKRQQLTELLVLRTDSSCWQRLRYLRHTQVRRNHWIENYVLRLTILLNLH